MEIKYKKSKKLIDFIIEEKIEVDEDVSHILIIVGH